MSVFVTLPDDLEQFLFAHAQAVGVPVETLLAQTIVERWDSLRQPPALPARETELQTRLQTLFPPEQTRLYQSLVRQSDAGTLSDADRERLLSLIEQRDARNAERLQIVAELAALHGLPLREQMARLGIAPE